MSDNKTTKLSIQSDRPTALSSSIHDANIDALGFNILYIAARNPKLAVEIMRLYTAAHKIQEDDPKAPEEDFALFADEVAKLLRDSDEA
ncbi:MAG TPA: hypothetical protein VLG92_03885 [Candidatus Saccharimonadia bacterium]|nr:hypothetical protein [Candidatus Saccharimonadia bacterium]